MDTITLILTALAAGALAGAQSTASDAVKDAYQGLKSLIQRKLTGKPEAELALAKHEDKPEIWKAPLADALTESGVDKDDEIVRAANNLMIMVNSHQESGGKYITHTNGNIQGFVQGDMNQVSINFGDKTSKK